MGPFVGGIGLSTSGAIVGGWRRLRANASLRSAGDPQGGAVSSAGNPLVGDPARRFGDCPGPAGPAPIAAERSEAMRPFIPTTETPIPTTLIPTTQKTGDPA